MWERLGKVALASHATLLYVGESPADLSVYAAPGWNAWLAMWSLIAEWTNDRRAGWAVA